MNETQFPSQAPSPAWTGTAAQSSIPDSSVEERGEGLWVPKSLLVQGWVTVHCSTSQLWLRLWRNKWLKTRKWNDNGGNHCSNNCANDFESHLEEKNKYYFLIHKTAGMNMSNDYNNQDNLISEAKRPQGQLVCFTWRWLPELQRL